MDNYQLCMVLQRRHLMNQPIELLVKVRMGDRRLKEVWIPESIIMQTSRGKELVEAFDQTKVARMGVDMYLGKRKRNVKNKDENGFKKKCSKSLINARVGKNCATNRSNNVVTWQTVSNCSYPTELVEESTSAVPTARKRTQKKKNKSFTKSLVSSNILNGSGFKPKMKDLDLDCNTGLSCIFNQDTNQPSVHHLSSFFDQQSSIKVNNSKSMLIKRLLDSAAKYGHQSLLNPNVPSPQLKCDNKNHDHVVCCCCSKTIPKQPSRQTILYQVLKNLNSLHTEDVDDLMMTTDYQRSQALVNNAFKSPFVMERRSSVRQMEGANRLKEVMVKKCDGFVHLVLGSQSKNQGLFKNAFNPELFKELSEIFKNLAHDDSKAVLISGAGSTFSSGIDLYSLLNDTPNRKAIAINMANCMRNFVNILISFPKPIVAAINGPAAGFSVAMLPLLDLVYASDKASFSCPYVDMGQTPEACSSYTFQKIMGPAMANDMLMRGRKITALEAHQVGLVTQVFWPENLMSEIIPRIQKLTNSHANAIKCTKRIMRQRKQKKLEAINDLEYGYLIDMWSSNETQVFIKAYIERNKERMDS